MSATAERHAATPHTLGHRMRTPGPTWPTRRHGGMGTEQVQVTVCVANAFTTVRRAAIVCRASLCRSGNFRGATPKASKVEPTSASSGLR